MAEPQVRRSEIKIAKIIGENEDGITLFVPKDESGTFQIKDGDAFLTIMFVRTNGNGGGEIWTPWE